MKKLRSQPMLTKAPTSNKKWQQNTEHATNNTTCNQEDHMIVGTSMLHATLKNHAPCNTKKKCNDVTLDVKKG